MLGFLVVLFFIIAILYSSVGFGGGSSYIALLSLSELSSENLRILALVCNLMVVSLNVLIAWRCKRISWRPTILLCIFSIPMAFLGGQIHLPTTIFKKILGIALILAASSLFFEAKLKATQPRKAPRIIFLGFGMFIGFISGITGIGGGVFLSPLLYLFRPLADLYIPGLCSVFIWVNSLAGIIGMQQSGILQNLNLEHQYLWLFPSVLFGAILGNRLQNLLFSKHTIRKATAVLLSIAACRLLFF